MEDSIVFPRLQAGQRDFYENYGANVLFESEDFEHTFVIDYPTDKLEASDCSKMENYPCNGQFDTTGKILSHLLTNIPAAGVETLADKDYDWASKGVYRKFNQYEFLDAGWFGWM